MRKFFLITIISSLSLSRALAVDFMTSARGGGMGFSYFLLADDPSGAVYNPAGVGYAKGWQSYLMMNLQNNRDYVVQQEEPYNGRFAIVYPLGEIGGLAVNTQQSGSLEKITGVPTVNNGVATFAREFAPGWSAGASFKYLYETMFGERSAYDFDLGISYRSSLGIIGAAAAENIMRAKLSPDYLGYEEYLPRRERVGLGYAVASRQWRASFTTAAQLEESGISQKYSTLLVNAGTEWWLLTEKPVSLGLRAGYTFGKGVSQDLTADYSGLSGGLSVNFKVGINDLRLDYGIKTYPYENSQGSAQVDHFLALNYGWGGVPDYRLREVEYAEEQPAPYKPEIPEQQAAAPELQPAALVQQPAAPEQQAVAPVQQPAAPVKEPAVPAKQPAAPEQRPKIDSREIAAIPEAAETSVPAVDKDTDFGARSYHKYDVLMDVTNISSADFRRIVFYLKPQGIIKTNNWKLYIFRAKIKDWSDEEIDRWALKVIEGRGVPPLNVVWDGISGDGKFLPTGKYYYVLTAEDSDGQYYATKWYNFRLE